MPGVVTMPLTVALKRQKLKEVDLFKFEANLVYIVSSRLARVNQCGMVVVVVMGGWVDG